MLAARQTVFPLPPKDLPFDLPYLGAFGRVLDAVALPGLLTEEGRVFRQVLDLAGWRASCQPRILLATTAFLAFFRPRTQDAGPLDPTVEVRRDLAHVNLPPLLQAIEEGPVSTIEFVERPGRHANPVAQRPVDQFQGDLGLGAEHHLGGNVGFCPALLVVDP